MAPEKEKITTMILYVDLKCPCCYKKVRKLLCKFPQIRDQVFDVDKNKVTITVVCCDPERFRDKLCCKGGRAIQSIEIVENKPPKTQPQPPKPPKSTPMPPTIQQPKPLTPMPAPYPKPPKPPISTPMPPTIQQPTQQPKPKPRPAPMPKQYPEPQKPPISTPMPGTIQQPPQQPNPPPAPMPPLPPDQPIPMDGYYPHQPFCPPISVCCQECYEGRNGGPCHYGYGRPVPPPPCYDYYGYQYPPKRPCYVSRCDYFSEDNPQGCSIM